MNYVKNELVEEIIQKRLKEQQSIKNILTWLVDTKKYKLTMAYRYLKAAQEKIQEYYDQSNKHSLAEAISQLEQQQQDAVQSKEYKLAFNIRQEISKLQGLYISKVDITSAGQPITTINVNIIRPTLDE